jgi:DNA-binding transcriptional ArsR family regulator
MVERLARGPASVKELATPIEIGMPSALKHLRVLEDGGIVQSEKMGRVRTYRMRPQAFRSISQWIKLREAAMNKAFDRLVQAMQDSPEKDD